MERAKVNKFSSRLREAIDVARIASRFCEHIRNRNDLVSPTNKRDGSPVTFADYGSQLIILNHLINKFPDDTFLCEESISDILDFFSEGQYKESVNEDECFISKLNSLKDYQNRRTVDNENFWVIDPLDGTKGYINNRQYCIAISYLQNHNPIFGVLACPLIEKLLPKEEYHGHSIIFFAQKGRGAYRVIENTDFVERIEKKKLIDLTCLSYTEPFDQTHSNNRIHEMVANDLEIKIPPIKIDSQCKYVLVALGKAHIYMRIPNNKTHREYIWDHAAGYILLNEVSGKITDLLGNKVKFSFNEKLDENFGIIAANKQIHDRLVAITKKYVQYV